MTTIEDLAFYLIEKGEHYPLSDKFIEYYQQTDGGYIAFARKVGHLVDPQKHEPNQKWHFYESWLLRSLQDGTAYWSDDANKTFYQKIQCPELLLWFLEAVGVDSSEVEAAKEIAERGKQGEILPARIAKTIREQVAWELVEDAMKS